MEKNFRIPCIMDQKTFRDFAVFNSFRFRWRVITLMLFPVFMIALAIVNRVTGSNVLFWLFLILGLFMPLSYLFRFEVSLRNQIRANQLEQPRVFYTVTIAPEMIVVENQTERQELPWDKLYRIFRYRDYIYIYATQARVFIVPCAKDGEKSQAIWDLCVKHIEKGRAQVKKG